MLFYKDGLIYETLIVIKFCSRELYQYIQATKQTIISLSIIVFPGRAKSFNYKILGAKNDIIINFNVSTT